MRTSCKKIVYIRYKYTHHVTSLGLSENQGREAGERGSRDLTPWPLWEQGQSGSASGSPWGLSPYKEVRVGGSQMSGGGIKPLRELWGGFLSPFSASCKAKEGREGRGDGGKPEAHLERALCGGPSD